MENTGQIFYSSLSLPISQLWKLFHPFAKFPIVLNATSNPSLRFTDALYFRSGLLSPLETFQRFYGKKIHSSSSNNIVTRRTFSRTSFSDFRVNLFTTTRESRLVSRVRYGKMRFHRRNVSFLVLWINWLLFIYISNTLWNLTGRKRKL